ncbi:hypothetical protein C8R45DRAFT_512635 [Mycena sanguinolenta]|nr:hypothetical protein C8R45DRAFT_512635 [Mycena sanguinolenta]
MPWSIDVQNPQNAGLSTLGNYPFDQYHALINMTAQNCANKETLRSFIIFKLSQQASGFSIGSDNLSNISESNYVRTVNIRRSPPVKIYAILVSVSIAAVSLIFFGMIVDIYLWGYNRRIEVLVLPIATLFAFTQLRQTLPVAIPATGTVLGPSHLLPFVAHIYGGCRLLCQSPLLLSPGSFGNPTR